MRSEGDPIYHLPPPQQRVFDREPLPHPPTEGFAPFPVFCLRTEEQFSPLFATWQMQFLPQYCPLLEKVTLSPNCGPQTCIHPEEKKWTPLKRHPHPGREKEALKLFSESISSQNVGKTNQEVACWSLNLGVEQVRKKIQENSGLFNHETLLSTNLIPI